ncbi:hypothetical protein GCM10009678_14010 [Actinomadura kijaniata]|uniref:Tetratricopeptide (TPR) repeat protein n=1 Tax=Actinomadura namibiensis TaxID=182080 RepID=A0A7W3QMJ7_ACTNM|nr:tetratricopeptide repeat protein [Actinomadura namibiensis]MBA8952571.1 tetratricopeptide (TPR) repeat protein [Actinomadura namibiensis]
MSDAHQGSHEGMADPRLEAEGELSMARLALDDGELGHAAEHVARALVHSPALPEAHELLARLAGHPGGGPELFALEEPVFLGTVLARAHVLAARGAHAEAFRLLVSAQCHQPEVGWADVPWMRDPALAAKLPPEEISAGVVRLTGVLPDPVPEEERAALEPFAGLVRVAAVAHPGEATLLWTGSMLLRRVGTADEAIDLAMRAEAADPSFNAAMALGYAYRAARRWDDAKHAWLRALELDPDNTALLTDIGELMATAGRPDEALEWVERALRIDPDCPSAFPTACGMRFDRDGGLFHLVAMADHLRAHPDNGHADRLLTHTAQRRYWLGHIPRPSEAVVNVLRQITEQDPIPDSVDLALSALEAPSALMAFAHVVPGSPVMVERSQEPDLRRPVPEVFDGTPVGGVARRVWEYDGLVARPAVPPPSPQAVEVVGRFAGYRWRHLPAAYDDAVHLSGLSLDDLLGLLVHPPVAPDPAETPEWIRSVQAWACLGIAHHRADQPWAESERRSVLVDLAYGPEDWVTEAALLALVAVAWTHPEARADVAGLVAWRFLAALRASRTRAVTILDSLAFLVRATPEIDDDVRGVADEIVDRSAG